MRLVVIALIVYFAAWARVGFQAVTQPSPAQPMRFVGEHATPDEGRLPHCHGPALAVGDAIWRTCEYSLQHQGAPGGGFIRFDLAKAEARMDWRLRDEAVHGEVQAAAWAEDGLRVALRGGSVLRLKPESGVEVLAEQAERVVAVVPDAVVVDANPRVRDVAVEVRPFDGGEVVALPPLECPVSHVCRAQRAERGPNGWTVWYSREAPEATTLELLRAAPGEAPTVVQALPIDRDTSPLGAKLDGRLLAFDDRGIAVRQGGAWAYLNPGADGEARWAFAQTAVVDGDGLRLFAPAFEVDFGPVVRFMDGDWHRFARLDGGLAVDGRPLDADARWLGPSSVLAPAEGGGFWLLGAFGTHIRLDAGFTRTDTLSLPARLWRVIERFGFLRSYNDLYLFGAPVKIAGYLLTLFGLPPLLLLGFALRRRRPRALPTVAALWSLAVVGFGWWFWQLTRHL